MVPAAFAAPHPRSGPPSGADCPTPRLTPPRYSPEMSRRGLEGTVMLDLEIDACGQVLEATVGTSSGEPALDKAALDAAREWILPAGERAKAVDGHVRRELSFGRAPDLEISYARLDWPRSHRRPRYVADDRPIGFASAAEAREAFHIPVGDNFAPPYRQIQSQFFRNKDSDEPEYWLFVYRAGTPNLAARYRLGTGEEQPVVRLAILCDDQPEACDKATTFLMKGFPFARARR